MSTSPRHHSFALLRSPLLPIDCLITQWQEADRSETDVLFQQLTSPVVEKALYVASPALYRIWQDWRDGVIAIPPLTARLALWRYIIRMSSRSTPFGLFAGVSTVKLTEHTCGDGSTNEVDEATRPDMGWLTTLINIIEQQPTIRYQLRYRPNNSLYQLGNQYRYSDYTILNGQRSFFINSVEQDTLLDTVLAYAQKESEGATGEQLIKLIKQQFRQSTEEATEYVDELINAHLLISELEPGVTGELPMDRLLTQLRPVPTAAAIARQLKGLHAIINKSSLPVAEREQTAERMRRMLGDACPPGDVLQTDMVRSSDAITVSERVVSQIGQQLTQLMPLRFTGQPTDLRTFAERYYARFGGQAQPLLVALDHESGIGYGPRSAQGGAGQSSLLQQLMAQVRRPTSATGDRLDPLRLKLLTNFLQTDQPQIITDGDLAAAAVTAPATSLSRSWSALGELYGTDAEAIDKGDYQFLLKSASGPSGVSLMARFCGSSNSLTSEVQRVVDWEAGQQPNRLLAELVHLPAGRIGNVVARPTLRAFEIPYLTPSSVDDAHTLPLSDLWVRVPDGKTVELWSKKHDRQVLPRNTTAHNYHGSDDIYRFLSDLNHQDESLSLRWSWGTLADQPALPRVTHKRIILARAQWTINKQKWPSAASMMAALTQATSLPRYVALVEADNELLLDLDITICQQLLYAELAKREQVRIVEWLATPSSCWLTCDGQRYTSELVIPFTSSAPPLPTRQSPFRLMADLAVQRTFLPGSEWLYVKVYAGEQTADELLSHVVKPFVHHAVAQRLVTCWFFIRYHDPKPHLRLRLRCPPKDNAALLNWLMTELNPWVDASRVQRVQVDTYERELERYGARTIDLCEQLFWQDSEWNLNWVAIRDEFDEDQQWWVACQRGNQLLDAFGLSLDEKDKLMTSLQERFLTENGANVSLRKQLNEQYRAWFGRLSSLEISSVDTLAELSADTYRLIAQLREIMARHPSEGPSQADRIIALLHMLFNRFFTNGQRFSEGVVYHFLARRYAAETARKQPKHLPVDA
ncbi:lantibiotic dehydratase [Fibrella aquatilis]|uniref:Lantibiotic dehydratase n=1 Tax=Fibrella aquatilis TaxID=2817059 RepID=A0A939JYA5_9BACT|nr:lantibiotic dehydratase [Fibrella aquatilis]MBO0931884.1 lantibiotic dehydratase [Fibrella aquatilis]